jgi:hypothetical protein
MHIMGIVGATIMEHQSNRLQIGQNSLERNRFFFCAALASATDANDCGLLTPVDVATIDAGADGV